MKYLLYTILALLSAGQSIAQITISSSPAINPGKVDSCNLPTPAALAALPSLAPVLNGSWDLGSTALLAAPFTYTYKAKTSGFSTASFSYSMAYEIGTSFGIEYTCWRNVQQSSTGVVILGEEILKRQAKPLGAITADPLDSIVFGQQTMAFSSSLPILKLPATMSSKWGATAVRTVGFNLTVDAYSLNNTPGQHKQIRNSLDSVVGWGRMKVPIAGKAASAWIPVLQVRHSDIILDSFFLAGSPAPDPLLNAIGVMQGQSNTVSRTFFYRAGAYRPLVEAVHIAPSHSSNVSKLYLHALDLPEESTGISSTTLGDVRIYPNPVRNGKLHLDISGRATAGWSYSLININGQQVAQGQLALTAATHSCEINLPQGLQPGIYYITLSHANEPSTVLPVTLQ